MGVGREAGKVMSNKAVADDMSGSTAIIGLVTNSLICAANLGDSRALLLQRYSHTRVNALDKALQTMKILMSRVLPFMSFPPARSGASAGPLTAVALSNDHKPDLPDERARVEKAGGIVKGVEVGGNTHERGLASLSV
jgi:hypothetical protein